jgi:membrane protease subunit (stomatin/prohibitin family)
MQPAAQAQAATVKCSKCGTENPTTAKFCVNCGNAMQTTVKCPKCGTEVAAGTKFCPNCGAKIK